MKTNNKILIILPNFKTMIKLKKIYITLLIGGCFSFGNIALNLAESFAQDNPETPPRKCFRRTRRNPILDSYRLV
ncbi:TPR repeat:TPR repeat [Crocosphaera watsonii WH 0401]|uniref:TPR repeat:TPR repeat n=1 Tax=Crocosphaera watsonii WH 0401 TaxID=555881 RepID=T2J3M8_CROWT|nr:TPR repeat:TPR repeat [Crocosphaera watsonii WH 0401]